MKQTRNIALLVGLCGVLAFGLACGNKKAAQNAERDESWKNLQQAKQNLDAERQKLADLNSQITAAQSAASEDKKSEEGAEAGPSVDDLQAQLKQVQQQVDDQTDAFNKSLVDFINANPVVEGTQPTEQQIGAIRMKTDEDMLVAKEYIDKGGDYRRAIEIYQTAMKIDPDNPKLKAALQKAEDMRYMTEDRFQNVQKGMSEDEVREQIGQVNLRNIRKYPEKGVVAWFYPKDGGGAAGVYFEKNKKSGEYRVYEAKFDAVKQKVETEE